VAFRGQYDYSLDVKNRLNVPPKFRAAFSEGMVLAKGVETCIYIWTPEAFEALTERSLGHLNPLSAEYRKVNRYFTHNAWDAELDATGRVTLNGKLLEHAEIEKAVVVAGTHDHVEVWNPDQWRAVQEELGAEIAEVAEGLGNPS
jgi:MraZ protein